MEQTRNRVITSKNGSLQFDRNDVLVELWKNATWLNSQIHKKQLKLTDALRQRVYMAQVHNGICKTIIYGLKDEDLELRVKELEETVKEGVVIPGEQKPKR